MKLDTLLYEVEIQTLIEAERLDELSKAALGWGKKSGHSEKDLDKAWKSAEAKVEKQSGKNTKGFSGREWGLTNTIYMGIVKKYSKGSVTELKKTMTKKTKTNTSNKTLAQRNNEEDAGTLGNKSLSPAAKKRLNIRIKTLTDKIKVEKAKDSTPSRATRIKKLLADKKELVAKK